jgi:hypothetical protein
MTRADVHENAIGWQRDILEDVAVFTELRMKPRVFYVFSLGPDHLIFQAVDLPHRDRLQCL